MFNRHDISRDTCQLTGPLARKGYDWWWHSFTGHDEQTGEAKSFYIEFFICNPEYGGAKPVLGQMKSNKKAGLKPSYLMVNAGSWGADHAQLHRFFGWRKVEIDYGYPFSISAGDCFLSEDATKGSVCVSAEESLRCKELMSDAGSMSWSLVMRKQVAFNVGWGASALMRRLHAFEMFWHAEGMKTDYRGEVIWNGRKFLVRPDDCYGYADKNWGRDFTSPWVWLSSCNLTSETSGRRLDGSVFDIGGGRPKIGPVSLDRKLLSAFYIDGKEYEFNFSKFWTFCRTKFSCRETARLVIWKVEQRTLRDRVTVEITARKRDMLLIKYESPDGFRRHKRLWNGGNGWGTVQLWHDGKLVDRIHAENVGCEYGEY